MPDAMAVTPGARPRTTNEASLVQNNALCAIIIWRFVAEYQRLAPRPCVLPLTFLIPPIVFHHFTLNAAIGTNVSSPLGKFIEKFDSRREEFLAIHPRMLEFKGVTLKGIVTANAFGLTKIRPEDAVLLATRLSKLPQSKIPTSVRPIIRAAEKLGHWCAPLSLTQISNQLRVLF